MRFVIVAMLVSQTVADAGGNGTPTRMCIPAGVAQIIVREAIGGAHRRLEAPDCQRVLDDFADGFGNNLSDILEAQRETASRFLSYIWFIDASNEPQCANGTTAAFTFPGSRVVFVCAVRFADPSYSLHGPAGEIIIIHELLHSLGLRENPPTSAQITHRVWARCGRS